MHNYFNHIAHENKQYNYWMYIGLDDVEDDLRIKTSHFKNDATYKDNDATNNMDNDIRLTTQYKMMVVYMLGMLCPFKLTQLWYD